MSAIPTSTRSLRLIRLQASLPRMLAGSAIAILCVAGIRAIVTPMPRVPVERSRTSPSLDLGAEAFAQAFTQAYLTGGASQPQAVAELRPFLAANLNPEAAVTHGAGQAVSWTGVVADQADGNKRLITVAARTNDGTEYLAVPVTRDSRGMMFIASYPAIVGAPSSDPAAELPAGQPVGDPSLQTVIAGAVRAYLAGSERSLLGELAPGTVVSLPAQRFTVTATRPATWVNPRHRVAIQVTATGARGSSLTLSYELSVVQHGRWYVQQIEVNPDYEGGGT